MGEDLVTRAGSSPHSSLGPRSIHLCLLEAEFYCCQFPRLLHVLQSQHALVPPAENIVFLINYSSAGRRVRDTLTALFEAAAKSGTLRDLQTVEHREATYVDGIGHDDVQDEERFLSSFQVFYRGPGIRAQCNQLSLHMPLRFDGLQFGALYCLVQMNLSLHNGHSRKACFLWCPNLAVHPGCEFPNPPRLMPL